MALDARHRSSIYDKFVPLLGEDDANALMSEFPSVEADELVTKDHLRAELALMRGELREEIAELGADLRGEISELRGEMGDLRTDLRGEISELRTDMGELRTDMVGGLAALRIEMAEGFRRQQAWTLGAIAAATAVLGTLTSVV